MYKVFIPVSTYDIPSVIVVKFNICAHYAFTEPSHIHHNILFERSHNYTRICTTQNTIVGLQQSLYFKTTHGTKKMWSYIAFGLKIKVI